MTYEQAKALINKIEHATDELGNELAVHGKETPKFRKLARDLKKHVIELAVRVDG